MLGQHRRTMEFGSGVSHAFTFFKYLSKEKAHTPQNLKPGNYLQNCFSCVARMLASTVFLLKTAPTLSESLKNTLEVPDHCPPVPILNINFSTSQVSEDQMF